jgi:hypothetical protein
VITKNSLLWKSASTTRGRKTCVSREPTPSSNDNSRNREGRSRHKRARIKSSSKSKRKRTKVSHCSPRVLALIDLSWILKKLFTTEFRKMLIYKEVLLTDVKNLLYQRTDDVERLQKRIGDTERQFVDCLKQIKVLGEKDEQRQKELEDLRGAARGLVDMVDPPEEGEVSPRPLLERLREAPKKVLKFLTEAPVACVSNALAIVKSFLPDARLEIFA